MTTRMTLIQCPECKLIPADQDKASLAWATCNRCGASFHAHKKIIRIPRPTA